MGEHTYSPLMENITLALPQHAAIAYCELLKENGQDNLRKVKMEILKVREIASVKMLGIEISEDELDVYERCLDYVLQHCSADEIDKVSGATQEELEDIRHQMAIVLKKYTDVREMASTAKGV
ncbi:hypothetical protein HYR99_41645 [Candidatus Poribacteria bacterium]|nr:hypothetical protein [Candidatus Poribacteria bacterium]